VVKHVTKYANNAKFRKVGWFMCNKTCNNYIPSIPSVNTMEVYKRNKTGC